MTHPQHPFLDSVSAQEGETIFIAAGETLRHDCETGEFTKEEVALRIEGDENGDLKCYVLGKEVPCKSVVSPASDEPWYHAKNWVAVPLSAIDYRYDERDCVERDLYTVNGLSNTASGGHDCLGKKTAEFIAAAPETARQRDIAVEALRDCKKMAELMTHFTACQADDEYVWGVQAKIDAALKACGVE